MQPLVENDACSRWSLGHITSMQNIQVRSSSHPPLQLLGNFIRCLKAQSFLAAREGESGLPREKKTHELVNETGESRADAMVVNCRQRMPRTCTSSASRFVSPTRGENSRELFSLSGCKLLPVWKTIPDPGVRERERESVSERKGLFSG